MPGGLLNSGLLVGMMLVVLCSQSFTLRVSAEEGDTPKLRDEKPQLREEKPSLELRQEDQDAPGLREDDGDIDVGGAGRDTTCAVPSDDATIEDAFDQEPLTAEEQYFAEEDAGVYEEATMERKTSFKEIKEIEEEDYVRIDEDFDMMVHNATVLGDPECQYWLGRAFEHGAINESTGEELIGADQNQAAQLYMLAAKSGHAAAALDLGALFELNQNFEKAAEWYMQGIELGSVGAAGRMGGLYEQSGRGEEAVQLYQEAAALGDAGAQADMGRLYQHGLLGVEQSITKAIEMYQMAAEQGDASAMRSLGSLYEHGNGVQLSLETAAQWYLKGAKGGDPFACMHIARCYKRGIGIEKSLDEAEKWVEEAVEGGLDGSELLEEREREEMSALKVPLRGGRPSRYTYIPICDRPLSQEEQEARDSIGFDGIDLFENQKVRWKRTPTEEYLKMDGVLFPIKPASAASAA